MSDSDSVPSVASTSSKSLPNDRLESWKEIGQYLQKSVTTAQRWEREEGLPVHRHEHNTLASVYALRSELDEWRRQRTRSAQPAATGQEPRSNNPAFSRRGWLAVGGAGIVGTAVWMVRPSGSVTGLHQVGDGLDRDMGVGVSPDGEHIAYVSVRPSLWRIVIAELQSGRERVLREDAGDLVPAFLRWSPDGRLLAFCEFATGTRWRVKTIHVESGVERQITQIDGSSLAWTPDGQNLIVADRATEDEPVAAWRVDLNSGEKTRVSTPPRGVWGDIKVGASPDGRHFATVRYTSPGDGDIWLQSWDGVVQRRLTQAHCWVLGFAFTPDGAELIFDASKPVPGLYRVRIVDGRVLPIATPGIGAPQRPDMNRRGRNILALTNTPWNARLYRARIRNGLIDDKRLFAPEGAPLLETTESPAFSKDGKWICWFSTRNGTRYLCIAGRDGTKTRWLIPQSVSDAQDQQWSPDGRSIAYTGSAAGCPAIWLLGVADGAARRFSSERFEEGNASWSPDGKVLYFRSNRDGRPRFYAVAGDGTGSAVPVTPEAVEGYASADGQYFLFLTNSQGAPLHAVRLATGEVTEVPHTPKLRGGFWAIHEDSVVYLDWQNQKSKSIVYRQRIGESARVQLVDLNVSRDKLVAPVAIAPGLDEVVWERRELNEDVWVWGDFH